MCRKAANRIKDNSRYTYDTRRTEISRSSTSCETKPREIGPKAYFPACHVFSLFLSICRRPFLSAPFNLSSAPKSPSFNPGFLYGYASYCCSLHTRPSYPTIPVEIMLSQLVATLRLWSAILILPDLAVATCYDSSGFSISGNWSECGTLPEWSICCYLGETWMDNELCLTAGGRLGMSTCDNAEWDGCVEMCPSSEYHLFIETPKRLYRL